MITLIPYDEKYEDKVQALYKIPVSSSISLSFQRHPHSLINAHIQTEYPELWIAVDRDIDQVIGIFNIGTRACIWDNKIQQMPYYCDLRIHPDFQNGRTFLKMLQCEKNRWKDLDHIPATTVIFADNHKMLEMVKKREAGHLSDLAPFYQKIADLNTFIFKTVPKTFSNHGYIIRNARSSDIQDMNQLQNQNQTELMLMYDFNNIGKVPYYYGQNIEDYILCFDNHQLVGMLGIWDTSSFKQTVVHKYSRMYKLVRPLYNLIASSMLSFPDLPDEGEKFNNLSIHSMIINKRNPDIFKALLSYITNRKKSTYMITLDKRDPLYETMLLARRSVTKEGHLFVVTRTKKIHKSFDWIPVDMVRI
jgi:hypothetical protein